MSLKAKIEAVIYAAEEPVTLAQLAGLFGAEVSELLAAARPVEPPPTEVSASQSAGAEAESAIAFQPPSVEVGPEATAEPPVPKASVPAAEIADEPAAAATAETASAAVADEKKAARQRDREIRDELKSQVNELMEDYSRHDRGMEIREVAGGYRVATKPEYHDAVRSFVKSLKPPMKLSLQALETLAVIAYKQPVTAPEVSEIRGVDSGGVLGSLISRKLITTAGRKQVIGRPILYKTTKEFLLRFGLKDVGELPSIEEFEKMAGEVEIEESPEPRLEGDLPFAEDDAGGEAASPVGAVEANAGEAGVAVAAEELTNDPDCSEPTAGPAAEVIVLDASVPVEADTTRIEDVEVVGAAHPTVPIEGE